MARARQRQWFKLYDADGHSWAVWLSPGRLKCGPVDCFGYCDFERRRIYLSTRQSHQSLLETVAHEIVHASCGTAPREDVDVAIEESICCKAERHLWAFMASRGFAVPELPDGVVLKPPRPAK